MRRKILVTAISGDVANSILKILQDSDAEVYGCDIYDFPVGMDRVKHWWKCSLAVTPGYVEELICKCKEFDIGYLIPANESEIKVISENLEVFHAAGIKVMIHTPETIHILQDKYKTIQFLKELDQIEGYGKVAVPATFLYNEFEDNDEAGEYIIKLRKSCGSKLLYKIKSKKEIEGDKADFNELVIQEYIPDADHEYTVGVFADETSISTMIFRRSLKHGYTSFVEYIEDDRMRKEAETIARALNLHGYINIQLRRYQGMDYIFEINARISGSVYFQYMLGHDVVNWWLDLLDGKEEHTYSPKYHKAVGIRELAEKYVVLEEKK